MNDQACLVDSLQEMNFRGVGKNERPIIESHVEPQNLVGYSGDKRANTAEVIIRRRDVGSASNDIGFKKGTDGSFKAIISQFDSGHYNAAWMTKLKQTYAEKKAKKIAKNANLTFEGKSVTPQGKIKLTFKVGI